MNKNDDQQAYLHYLSEEEFNAKTEVGYDKRCGKKIRIKAKELNKVKVRPVTKHKILCLKKVTDGINKTLEEIK